MEGLTRALAVELARLRVNIRLARVVRTPLWANMVKSGIAGRSYTNNLQNGCLSRPRFDDAKTESAERPLPDAAELTTARGVLVVYAGRFRLSSRSPQSM